MGRPSWPEPTADAGSVIRGYPRRPSVAPGQVLTLHVSTDAARFRVAMHRWADGFVPMLESSWLPGARAAEGLPSVDWQWPAYRFDIPRHWPSGVYVAHLLEPVPRALRPAMDSAAALFVVLGQGRSPWLYKLPLATYQAYNCSGGGCFYFRPPHAGDPAGARLSWRRPGGGIGGDTYGAADHYDPASPRQTFAHWDARFIRWLARRGIAPDFCTDLDLHRSPGLLGRYRLLISVGHDEYWSEAMRTQVERFVEGGGNLCLFGANLCWWRIHFADDDSVMRCHQGGPEGPRDLWWSASGAARPEDGLTGVSYRHGGGWWDGPRRTTGFIVQRPEHWVFAGTGLERGARFGAGSWPPLVGYECDGAPLQWIDPARGLLALAPQAGACGTPPGFLPLAAGLLDGGWQELPRREADADGTGPHSATLGLHRRGAGTVFTTGTTDWAQVLANRSDPSVERITATVLGRLGGTPWRARLRTRTFP